RASRRYSPDRAGARSLAAAHLAHGLGDLRLRGALDARVRPGAAEKRHDKQYLVRTRGVADRHRHRVHGIVVPSVLEPAENHIDRRARAADLGIARDESGTAAGALAHREPDPHMDHAGAVLEIARRADDDRLAIAARLQIA